MYENCQNSPELSKRHHGEAKLLVHKCTRRTGFTLPKLGCSLLGTIVGLLSRVASIVLYLMLQFLPNNSRNIKCKRKTYSHAHLVEFLIAEYFLHIRDIGNLVGIIPVISTGTPPHPPDRKSVSIPKRACMCIDLPLTRGRHIR